MGGYAWVTLATNDSYSLGALVLAHSLRRVGTKHDLAVLVTPGVTEMMREKLAAVFSLVQEVNVLDSKDETNLALLARPELGITFTKLHCWRLTQYEKCVFVDADTLVVRNCDELFEREELSAAPDVGWPDCFNSGVFVFRPSQQTFASITAFAAAKGSFDGGDQGLLNMYFNDWAHKDISKHLPFIYNMCSTATYSYLPALKQFGDDVRIIHFIGATKPWLQYFDTLTGIVHPSAGADHLQPMLQLWWNVFCEKVHAQLTPAMATSTLAPIWHPFTSYQPPPPPQTPIVRNAVYYDTTDETYTDIQTIRTEPPDFSEFKDPWDDYQRTDFFTNDQTNERNATYYHTVHEEFTVPLQEAPVSNLSSESFQQKQPTNKHYNYEYNHQFHVPHEPRQEQNSNFAHYKEQHYKEEHFYSDNNYNQVHGNHQREQNRVVHQDHREDHRSDQHHQERINFIEHRHYQDQSNHFHKRRSEHEFQQQRTEQIYHHHPPQNFPQQEFHHQEIYRQETPREIHRQDAHHQTHHIPPQNTQEENINHNSYYEQKPCEIHQSTIDNRTDHFTQIHEESSQKHNEENIFHRRESLVDQSSQHNQFQDNYVINHQNENQNELNVDRQIDRQIDVVRKSPPPPPPPPPHDPCTDLHNVAPQSDLNITGHLDNSNAGLAGALAQMTLGAPRTAEQIAYEEHMRKQCWEQGQIDYMGRDSFDNIWKKICETLSLAPQRQPTPPKESSDAMEITETKSEEPKEPEKSVTDATVVPSTVKTDTPIANVDSGSTDEQLLASQIPTETISAEQMCEKKSDHKSSPQLPEQIDIDKNIPSPVETSSEGEIKQSIPEPVSQQILEQPSTESERKAELSEQLLQAIQVCPMKPKDQMSTETIALPLSLTSEKEVSSQQPPSETLLSKPQSPVSETVASQTREVPIPPVEQKTEITDKCLIQKPEPPKASGEELCSKDAKCTVDVAGKLDTQTEQSLPPQTPKTEVKSKPLTVAESVMKSVASAEISAAADATTSPVPIQVAESVLQTEPKECVVEEPKLIHEEITTSIDTRTQGPATTTSQIIVEPKTDVRLAEPVLGTSSLPNGSEISCATPEIASANLLTRSQGTDETDAAAQENLAQNFQSKCEISEKPDSAQSATESTVPVSQSVEQDAAKLPEAEAIKMPEQREMKLLVKEQTQVEEKLAEPEQEVAKLPESESSKLPSDAIKLPEPVKTGTELPGLEKEVVELAKSGETSKLPEPGQSPEEPVVSETTESTPLTSLEPAVAEVPVRPTRTKEITIPPTPTVTEPTPPTSPPTTQELENQGKMVKKTVKKVVKKSSQEFEPTEGAEGESCEKKTVKKVVKKVVKKPKDAQEESPESSGATEKTKKTVKTVKKVTKPAQTLTTDPSVPETPPPGTSDAPVPPKRKTKTTTKSTTAKKSDTEP